MKPRFSRQQKLEPSPVPTNKELSAEVRQLIWNGLYRTLLQNEGRATRLPPSEVTRYICAGFLDDVWQHVLGRAVDDRLHDYRDHEILKSVVSKAKWHQVFDLMSGIAQLLMQNDCPKAAAILIEEWNDHLQRGLVLWKFTNGGDIVPAADAEQGRVLESVLTLDREVANHFRSAYKLFRENADSRAAIHQAISGIEAAVRHLLKNEQATLGQALKGPIPKRYPPPLTKLLEALYDYRGATGGVAHGAGPQSKPVDSKLGMFFLVSSAAAAILLVETFDSYAPKIEGPSDGEKLG